MSSFSVNFDPTKIDPSIRNAIRTFIIRVSRNEDARWPMYECPIYVNNTLTKVKQGYVWEYRVRDNEIYACHTASLETPTWIAPLLCVVSEFFKFEDDVEVQSALTDIVCKIAADLFKPLQNHLIQTMGGDELTRLAINDETRALAAEYPPTIGFDPANPEGSVTIWRLRENGGIVDITQPGWHIFPITS